MAKKHEYQVAINIVVKAKNPGAALRKAWDIAYYGSEETAYNTPPKGIQMIWVPTPTIWDNEISMGKGE